jgi:hypothetical protein
MAAALREHRAIGANYAVEHEAIVRGKKAKKIAHRIQPFFSPLMTGCIRLLGFKAAKLAANRRRDDSVLPHADN